MKTLSSSIIGSGRLGTALQHVLLGLGYSGISMVRKGEDVVELGELIFITTPDAAIEEVALKLAEIGVSISGKMVVHCSGTIGLDALQILEQQGAEIGCFHPLQAITKNTTTFAGCTFDVMGTPKVLRLLKTLAEEMGANALEVSAHQKEMLHVAAVMAANYQVTLAHVATEIAGSSGLNPEKIQRALVPLMHSVIGNLEQLPLAKALTGPIARGDAQTIERHLHLLHSQPTILELYQKLGALTVDMLGEEQLSVAQKSELKEKLQ